MKKLLAIIILGLLWCEVSFALSQDGAINSYLKDRELHPTEGIWVYDSGTVFVIYKEGSSFHSKTIKSATGNSYSGQLTSTYTKGSDTFFYGNGTAYYAYYGGFWGDKLIKKNITCSEKFNLKSFTYMSGSCWSTYYQGGRQVGYNYTANKIWPTKKTSTSSSSKNSFIPSSGTAFFITQKGHVITNFHVVKGCKDKSKIVYQDKEVKAKLLAKDKHLDLALLKADVKNKHFIKISNKSPKKLQRIIAAGYPFGKELSDDLKFTSGIVSSLKGLADDSTRIQIDAALNYGNSGGPIVDEKTGELVAVAVSGLTKEITESINFGIKAGSVKNFLDSNQINTSLAASNFSWSSVGLSAILENATVYTFCK